MADPSITHNFLTRDGVHKEYATTLKLIPQELVYVTILFQVITFKIRKPLHHVTETAANF